MIAFWIGIPVEARLFLVAMMGLVGGALANHLIYRLAYFDPRPISPWGPAPEQTAARSPLDRIPVSGWWRLRREATVHGSGFWIRPALIELGTAAAMVWLYWFETQTGQLLPEAMRFPNLLVGYEPIATQVFFFHAALLVLMIAATFIDFDERTIPDGITIPGTLIALLVTSLTCNTFLPSESPVAPALLPTTFEAPWFAADARWMSWSGLSVGLAIWTMWCFALADRRWSSVLVRRRGLARAARHFVNGLFHYPFWKVLAVMWGLGAIGVSAVWSIGGTHWLGLFSSLVGLAAGGGVIWSIRIVATWSLNVEAMGFGDVTLMAMIGAFIGWQAAVIAFFLSPFAAILIVLIRYIITRDAYTPFGPYLCAGAMLSIYYWDRMYTGWLAGNLILMGPALMWLMVVMLVLMAAMLFIWRHIKMALFRES